MIRKILNLFLFLLLLLSFVLFACQNKEEYVEPSKAVNVGTIDKIPKKKSELNGWQNIKIRKCGNQCCELVFPPGFGHKNKKQLAALRNLVNSHLEHDIDCMLQTNEDALKQIKFLATENQDDDAALMILSPNSFGGFNLDGALAEEYSGEYQLPVLEKYQKLDAILNVKRQEEVSTDLCSWLEVLGETSDRERVKKLIPYFKSKNIGKFADIITEKCGNVLK